MRTARIRYDDDICHYHVMNRVAGPEGYFPFGEREKEKLFSLATELLQFYTVDMLSIVVMGNHFHAVCATYPEPPTTEEMIERWRTYYGSKKAEPNWKSPAVREKIGARMRDLSCFMKDWQQFFSTWFNETRKIPRHGRLWADRFKSNILEEGNALWEVIKYIEMNPVRAKLVSEPGEYRFCTLGIEEKEGKHPFREALSLHLKDFLGEVAVDFSTEEVLSELRADIARVVAAEAGAEPEEIREAVENAKSAAPPELHLTQKIRFWSAGAIIGSKKFVRTLAAKVIDPKSARRKLAASKTVDGKSFYAYCRYRQPT